MYEFINRGGNYEKILSILLSFIIVLNISSTALATSPLYRITEEAIGGRKVITIEYTENGNNVKSVMGAGFRTTSVYNQSSLEMDLYMSEYSEKYDLETSHLTKSEALNDLNSYKSDKYLGHFSLDENSLFSEPYNNSSDAFNVTSQYLVTKYVSEYLDAYYYHYSDDQHLLKFSGNAFSIFTTDSFIINTCSTFKSNLMSYDSKHLDIIIDIVGYVPYGGTAAAITQAISEVISNEGMTSDTLFDAVMILVTAIPGIGAIANTGLLVSDLALAYAYYHDAKNAYNTVKSYT